MQFLVAYDIAHPRRLRRVARCLEKRAVRVQKSVFLFSGDERRIEALLDETAELLDLKADVVQAWKLAVGELPQGRARGVTMPALPSAIVLDVSVQRFVAGRTRRWRGGSDV